MAGSADGVSFKDGLDNDTISGWLAEEANELLDELDPAAVLGRPPEPAGVAALYSDAACGARLGGSEVRRLRQVMVFEDSLCVGFSVCALVQRPFLEAAGERRCRICLEGDEDEELLEACACRGSMQYVHGSCLVMQWKATGKPEVMLCGLCHQAFVGKASGILAAACSEQVQHRRKEEKPLPRSEPEKKRQEELLVAQISSATALWRDGKLQEAADSFREALRGLQELLGDDNTKTLTAHHNLGLVLQAQDKIDEAWEHIRRAAAGFSAALGAGHALTLKALHNEALIAQKRGRLDEAERGYRQVLEARKLSLGDRHADTLKTAGNLGLVLYHQKRSEEAALLLRETMRGLAQVLGRQHPLTLTVMQNLSLALASGRPGSEEALSLGREAAEGKQLALGTENMETVEGWRDLAALLIQASRYAEAEPLLRQVLAGQERLLGFHSRSTQQTLRQLSDVLRQQGNEEEADKLCKQHGEGVVVATEPLPTPEHRGPLAVVLLALYVLPAHRGRGVGRAVVELWKDFARASDAASLELELAPEASCWGFFSTAVGMVRAPQSYVSSERAVQLHYAL